MAEDLDLADDAFARLIAGLETEPAPPPGFEEPEPLTVQLPPYYASLGDGTSEFIGVRTGLPRLDQLTSGLSGLIVLGGTPGSGKSAFTAQIAYESCARYETPVLLYSLEMPHNAIITRMINRIGRVHYREILLRGRLYFDERHPHYAPQPLFERIKADLAAVAPRFTIIDRATRALTLADIQMTIQAARNRHERTPLVIIDSLHAFPVPTTEYRDAKDKIDALMNGFRVIADHTGAAIILISHINRESAKDRDRTRTLQSFLGSSGIEHTADMCLILQNEEEDADDAQSMRPVSLHIPKNRYGMRCAVRMDFEPVFSAFTESS